MSSVHKLLRALTILLAAACLPGHGHGQNGAHPFDGAWFDPAHDGEGWIVEVLPDDTAVVYWFTYPPAGAPGTQAWMQGVGEVFDDRIEITGSVITRGPAFGPEYGTEDLELSDWGTWTMTFSDCDTGAVSYEGPAAFGSGEFSIERLTGLQGSACGPPEENDPGTTGFSGSWFDLETDGQGITLGVLPDGQALLYWFTYTPEGEQAWVFGTGTAKGGRFEFPDMLMPVGTEFGSGFDPTDVVFERWGSLSLTFDTCGIGILNYRSDREGWGSGWMPLQRLTALENHPCELAPPAPLHEGAWAGAVSMNPGLSESAAAVLNGKAYVAGDLGPNRRAFLRLDPETDTFQRLADLPAPRHHPMMAAHDGRIYLFGGISNNLVSTDTVWRYDPAEDRWTEFGTLPGFTSAGTAVADGKYIYVIPPGSGMVWRLDPDAEEWMTFPGAGHTIRDHAAAVLFRGEIWWMGGRSARSGGHRSVEIFDPVTRVWRPGPAMSGVHTGFAAAVVRGRIMVAGGEIPASTLPDWQLVPSLEIYSPQAGEWRRGPSMPTPVHGSPGVALDGRFYVLGGSTEPGFADNTGIAQVYVPGG